MNNLNLRMPAETLLHHALISHLRKSPETYPNLWELYSDPQGLLFNLLQRMLDAGEISADNLKNGLITDRSVIRLMDVEVAA